MGSTFTVRLPLLTTLAPAAALGAHTTATREQRVLVVDDAPDAARRLADLVGAPGDEVRAVTGWGRAEDRERTAEAGFNHDPATHQYRSMCCATPE